MNSGPAEMASGALQQAPGQNSDPAIPYTGLLPDPSAALRQIAQVSSGRFRYGSEFESTAPHNNIESYPRTALFSPTWAL